MLASFPECLCRPPLSPVAGGEARAQPSANTWHYPTF